MKTGKLITTLFIALILGGCSTSSEPQNIPSTYKSPEPLLILQAYGTGGETGGEKQDGVNRSFVELYNPTERDVNLSGYTLHYADGTTVASDALPNTNTEDGAWKKITLTGTIPSGASYLILGPVETNGTQTPRYEIEAVGDIINDTFVLSSRAFKVAIIYGTNELTVQNPFDTNGNGTKITGYIDMVGAANNYSADGSARDRIFGFEGLPAWNSGSEAVRRVSLTDTNNNRGPSTAFPEASGDFTSIRYAVDGISNEELEVRKPRSSREGAWDPFQEPEEQPGDEPGSITVTVNFNGIPNETIILTANNGDALKWGDTLEVSIPNADTVTAWFLDGELLETETSNPLVISITGLAIAKHTVTVIVRKGSDNTPYSSVLEFTVER